jgi:uncharacterized protein YdaU (DUF1376 family)
MPLWIGSYLADTLHLSRDEHGGYLLLIMAYWRSDNPLPDDDKKLAAIVRATPKEWKTLKPVMAEFFDCSNGVWRHQRIDQELVAAGANRAQKSAAGKASAVKRWGNGKVTGVINPLQDPLQRQDNPTPTPTPSPSRTESGSTHTEIYSEQAAQACVPTPAGAVCKRMIELGISPTTCNPGNPTLQALLDAGATLVEFEGAARSAVEKGKPFNYVIGTVKRQREEAAKLVLHQGAMPNRQERLEAGNRAVADTWAPPELKTGTDGGVA